MLKTPIDFYFMTAPLEIAYLSSPYYVELLQLAITTESDFLFREAACRLIGDPSYSNEDIKAKFASAHLGILQLLLEKRAKLQTLMDNIQIGIFTIQAMGNRCRDPQSIATAAAGFCEELANTSTLISTTNGQTTLHDPSTYKTPLPPLPRAMARRAPMFGVIVLAESLECWPR